jgi:hypothetical protein
MKKWKERLSLGKIRGDVTGLDPLTPTTAAFHVHTNSTKPPTPKPMGRQELFCVVCENRGHWAQDCKDVTDVKDRKEKLKLASRCFLCLNRGHSPKNCSKKGKFIVQSAENPIITPSAKQTNQYPLP